MAPHTWKAVRHRARTGVVSVAALSFAPASPLISVTSRAHDIRPQPAFTSNVRTAHGRRGAFRAAIVLQGVWLLARGVRRGSSFRVALDE